MYVTHGAEAVSFRDKLPVNLRTDELESSRGGALHRIVSRLSHICFVAFQR